jgi:hypothetical protein
MIDMRQLYSCATRRSHEVRGKRELRPRPAVGVGPDRPIAAGRKMTAVAAFWNACYPESR